MKAEETSEGIVLIVEGVDILDGTTIYDIKPYLPSDCHVDAKASYSATCHKLTVLVSDDIASEVDRESLIAIISCIEDDPRPSYQDDCNRTYNMIFGDYEISFIVENNIATITNVKK